MAKRRLERAQRITQIYNVLQQEPDCFFTAGMVAQRVGLTRSPYLLALLDELVSWPDAQVYKGPVIRLGKRAWGYWYSREIAQQSLNLNACL